MYMLYLPISPFTVPTAHDYVEGQSIQLQKLHAENRMFENGMSARHARTRFSSPNIGFCTRSKAMQSIGNYFLYALIFDMVMRSWNREGA